MGLAVYSPRLDAHGHSVRGVAVLKAWSHDWDLGIFGGSGNSGEIAAVGLEGKAAKDG